MMATGSPDTIRSIRRNVAAGDQQGISTETIQKLARPLKTTVEWLLNETGREEIRTQHVDSSEILDDDVVDAKTVPLVGYVGAGSEAHYYAVPENELERVAAPEWASAKTRAVEVRGESLGRFFDRWIVYYDEVRRPVTNELIGKLCIVGLEDDRILIKKLRRSRDGLFTLLSNNEDPIENVAVAWAARVRSMEPR